jgi:hypothetical protein
MLSFLFALFLPIFSSASDLPEHFKGGGDLDSWLSCILIGRRRKGQNAHTKCPNKHNGSKKVEKWGVVVWRSLPHAHPALPTFF